MRFFFSTIFLLMVINSHAQPVINESNDAFGTLFRQSVKSCDEFMCRFNEEEFFPDLDASDPQLEQKNFMLLFDYELAKTKGKDTFINDVRQFYNVVKADNVKLKFESRNWYAELRSNFFYKKKAVELGLVLQPEKTPKGLWCWTIVGVNGLEKVGYADSTSRLVISPEQNEAEFMEIESDFKFSSKQFSQFRSYNSKLDALSYFFALVESGTLIFNSRIETVYHFYDVPSYIFTLKYHDRKKSNTGWLITTYNKVSMVEREKHLKELLSNK